MAVPPREIGAATSLATLSRSLGSTLGIAVFGNIFGLSLAHNIEGNMAAATAGVPPAFLAQLRPSAPSGGGEEGAPVSPVMDEAALLVRIHEGFEAQRAALTGDGPDVVARRLALDGAEAEAGAVAKKVSMAFKTAFTDAVSRIYSLAIIFSVLGLLLTLVMKELPLRGGPVPAAASE